MSNIALKVENVSKQYRLGYVGTRSLKDDLNRWWHQVKGLEDPLLKIGDTNVRSTKGTSDYVWALKDINFDVHQGEVLGVIGKNGAGKSTLLKLLSKVTAPTTGRIKVDGRIASLLEVGTGFHPELTGRENIFLNGAILGMTKAEIKKKFDEIVDFAGVERYIDTPVKRYSSGMYVRLAFAVAAYLEPEILIVDEVLAVGDAEFQKKAIGKMKEVSAEGKRTVLFVSHNMASIKKLCSRCILMKNGTVLLSGGVEDVVNEYLYPNRKDDNQNRKSKVWDVQNSERAGGYKKAIREVWFTDVDGNSVEIIEMGESFYVHFKFDLEAIHNFIYFGMMMESADGVKVLGLDNSYTTGLPYRNVQSGEVKFLVNKPFVNQGQYYFSLAIVADSKFVDYVERICSLTINPRDVFKSGKILSPGHALFFNKGSVEFLPNT
ncbi:MAG: lipopolysaccharide transport system ATP-binding protein [Gammaproteobacteria bacterium]|jgi:lipopolysaccharide transport system ATP-binding protein